MRMRTGDRREETPRLTRLTVELIGQEDGRIAAPLCRLGRRRTQLTHAARDMRRHIRQLRRQRRIKQFYRGSR